MVDTATSSQSGSQIGRARILIVDRDAAYAEALRQALSTHGFDVQVSASSEDALARTKELGYVLALYDLSIPGADGLQIIEKLLDADPQTAVILLSPNVSASQALEAIKRGAADFLSKRLTTDELVLAVRKALERKQLRSENELLKTQVSRRYSFGNIVSQSQGMLEIFETIKKISDYKTTVMLYGESGTGKELIAKAIHYNSIRKNRRFIAINCGAIPENLLESELFGHKKGAFTDALRDKKGLFEEAEGGTVLLDEIGELPLHLQVKLLRVLQENEIRPVGEARVIPIDVRVIAATLRDLEQDVIEGRFRDDLYYRLHVISLRIPPLRERRDDIPLLVNHFLKRNQERLGLAVYGVAKDAMAALMEHDWPGNIRELENCIERAMILTEGQEITLSSLPKNVFSESKTTGPIAFTDPSDLSIKKHARTLEETLIRRALEKTHGNRTHAAKLLEISHRTLLYKLKEYQLVEVDDDEIA